MQNGAQDPVGALTYAIALPTDSPEQDVALKALKPLFEAQPVFIPALLPALVANVAGAGTDSLLKRWTLELLRFALSTPSLTLDARTQLSSDTLQSAATLLATADNAHVLSLAIQCFSGIYPLLFRLICGQRNYDTRQWDMLSSVQQRIIEFVDGSPPQRGFASGASISSSMGVRVAAIKFAQRVILTQTRLSQDPRLQNRADPNISLCPPNHPYLNAAELEQRGNDLLTRLMQILYTSSNTEILIAIINAYSQLAKLRPILVPPLITAMVHWTPGAIANETPMRMKSVEKAVYIFLNHMLRTSVGAPYAGEITRALDAIVERIRYLGQLEQARRNEAMAQSKRAAEDALTGTDAKRIKLDPSALTSGGAAFWRGVDANVVTELVVANLQHFSEADVKNAIQQYNLAHPAGGSRAVGAVDEEGDELEFDEVKAEDLKLEAEDIEPSPNDDAEVESDSDGLELQVGEAYQLPPPQPLNPAATNAFLRATMQRFATLSTTAVGGAVDTVVVTGSGKLARGPPPAEMGMLLMIRTITRAQRDSSGTKPESTGVKSEGTEDTDDTVDVKGKGSEWQDTWTRNDMLRNTVSEYVLEDFPARVRIATLWMNEEWYNGKTREDDSSQLSDYELWLSRLLDGYRPSIDNNDRTFSQFLLDLPYLPDAVFTLTADLCVNKATSTAGLDAARELVTLKPSVREKALKIILDLTTHPDTALRVAAIKLVKRWVPDVQPMDRISQHFAVGLMQRLEAKNVKLAKPADDADMANGDAEAPSDTEPLVDTPYLPPVADTAVRILQHVQLIFALCGKAPDLLEKIFDAYSRMDEPMQASVIEHLVPVFRSIGAASGTPAYAKLLHILRHFQPGAESLVLRIINILGDNGRPGAALVSLIRELIAERNLDARFLIPIISDMDKAEIIRQIPRVVSMLGANVPGSKPGEEKALVKSVFVAVLEKPAHGFGKVSTNLPRLKESQLLEPVRLLVLLHESSEISMTSARDAIDICFGLTDFFPSEVLAATIQQLVDNAILPVLFMRTVIQAIKTYKTLIPYVAGGLMTRLIQKKIWTLGKLWDGFVLCGKIIAPASYPSLLLLPTAQLAEVAEKQPALRTGLREYVLKKGGNTSRYLDVLGREDPAPPPQPIAA